MADEKRKLDRKKLTKQQREMLDERAALLHKIRLYRENEGVQPIDESHRELIGYVEALVADVERFAARDMFKGGRANGVLAKEALNHARRMLVALQAIRLPQSNGDE